MFICGSGSLSNQDEADNEAYVSPCSTPKRSRRSSSFCKITGRDSGSKNPYSDRGLDKFYALLADLDHEKQKIYTQKGSEDISFVRFVYTNDSDSAKPIVVKVKERNNNIPHKTTAKNFIDQRSSFKSSTDHPESVGRDTSPSPAAEEETPRSEKTVKKRRSLKCKESFKLEDLKHPQFYIPVMVVFILLFLAIFGRSFAILCTSIGWYLAPTISGGSASTAAVSGERKLKRKKEYVRKKSENSKMISHVHNEAGPSSPKSVINGLNRLHQQQHDRKRSC